MSPCGHESAGDTVGRTVFSRQCRGEGGGVDEITTVIIRECGSTLYVGMVLVDL